MSLLKTSKPKTLRPKSGGGDALTVARQALRIARSLRSAEELKFFEKTNSTTDFATGVIYSLSNVAQGQTDITRIGDHLTARRLDLRLRVYDLVNSNTTFRIILFRQKIYSAFAVGNLMSTDTTLGFLNEDTASSWVVLKDWTVVQNSNFNLQDRSDTIITTVNLNNLDIEFTGPAAGDYQMNHLWMYVTADYVSAAGAQTRPVAGEAGCFVNSRLYFVDA